MQSLWASGGSVDLASIEPLALFFITHNVVSIGDLLEAFLGRRDTGIEVRVKLLGK
jgi:hypothetical protein